MFVEHYFINQSNNREVTIGGVKSLLEVSPTTTIVKVAGAKIEIVGDNLKITRFDENEIKVSGKINNIITEK